MKNALLTCLACLLLAGLVAGLSVNETAAAYAKSGETVAVSPFKVSSGTTYYLVKINGAPAIFLQPSDGGFEAVTSEDKITSIATEFVQSGFDDALLSSTLKTVEENALLVQNISGDCSTYATRFFFLLPMKYVSAGGSTVQLWFWLKLGANSTYKTEYDAVISLNASQRELNSSLKNLGDSVEPLRNGIAAKNADAVFESLNGVSAASSSLRKAYMDTTAAFTTLNASKNYGPTFKYMFYLDGVPHLCNFNANVTDALTKIDDAVKSDKFMSTKTLVDKLKTAVTDRVSQAQITLNYVSRKDAAGPVYLLVANVSAKYVSANSALLLSGLQKKKEELINKTDALKNAKTLNESTVLASAFDSLVAEINTLGSEYATLYPTYTDALAAVKNASSAVDEATKKYGTDDERVVAVQKQLTLLKQSLSASESKLTTGSVSTLSFSPVKSNALNVTASAASLAPKESQIDFVLIGGVVAVLLLLGGTVFYMRKMKKPGM